MVVYWSEVVEKSGISPEAMIRGPKPEDVITWEILEPHVEEFPDGEDQIRNLLDRCQELRNQGKLFVTSTSHHCVGVSGVIDGKLPDGTVYQWRKRRSYSTPT